MALTAEYRIAISDLISLHGHLIDEARLDELGQVFSSDVIYELSDFGLGSLQGLEAIRGAASAMGEANPVGHHVTNIVVFQTGDQSVRARSKGIGVNRDGTTRSVTYEDEVVRRGNDWRIAHRKVIARRAPLIP